MIIGYARVSTDDAGQDISIEAQVRELHAAGCDRVIAERRSAHKDGARPGWDELRGLVAAGQVTRVVAMSLSRLSRRGEDVPFLRMCARRGVEVVLLDGTPAATGDPASKLLTGVLSLVNEIDSDIKSINIKRGLARRKADGHYACGRVPFGYAYDGSQVVPHPTEFAEARQLWEWLAAVEFNMGRARRQHRLDWSQRGLNRWVDNPILRGIVRNKADAVAALITWDEWHEARRLQQSRARVGCRAPRVLRPFSAMLRCGSCGRSCHYMMAAGKPRLKCTNVLCSWYGRGLAEWKVRAQVIRALRTAAADLASTAAAPAEVRVSPEQETKRQQLTQLEGLAAQGVPGLEPTIEALRLELLAPPPAAGANWAGLRDVLLRPGVLEGSTDEELRKLVLEFVAELIYIGDPNRIEIRLRHGPGHDAT